MPRLFASALLVSTLFLAANGCCTVKPYEREYLTRPGMDNHDEQFAGEFEAHVQSAREGAIGGHGLVDSTGGGCGCN
jgi:Domain of unknown function (DUF4266)